MQHANSHLSLVDRYSFNIYDYVGCIDAIKLSYLLTISRNCTKYKDIECICSNYPNILVFQIPAMYIKPVTALE